MVAHARPRAMVHASRGHFWYGRQRLPVVDRDGWKGRVLLAPMHGVRWRQALALVLGGRVVRQGLVVAGSHVLRLKGGQRHCLPGFRPLSSSNMSQRQTSACIPLP